MPITMTATEARTHFGEVLRRVKTGEHIIVTTYGKPKVVILSIQEYERLKAARDRRLEREARNAVPEGEEQ